MHIVALKKLIKHEHFLYLSTSDVPIVRKYPSVQENVRASVPYRNQCADSSVWKKTQRTHNRYSIYTPHGQTAACVHKYVFEPNQKLCVIIQKLDVDNLPCINTETWTPPVQASCYRLFSSECQERIHCMHFLP